jgi:uncharacterized protein YdaU (DUF1376 family)
MHYFKLHINDYAQATSHLTLVEDAVYTRLLRKYYADEKPLPADIDRLQRLVGARSREEKAAVLTVLAEFFFRDGDFFRNKRADEELVEYEAKSLKAKESANARWMRSHTGRIQNAEQTQSEGNANHKPITNNQSSTTTRSRKAVIDRPDEVTEQTWNDYVQLRKQKRADLTATALDALKREAQKVGWSLDAVLQECIVRGWTGFKAGWVQEREKTARQMNKDDAWDFLLGRNQSSTEEQNDIKQIR